MAAQCQTQELCKCCVPCNTQSTHTHPACGTVPDAPQLACTLSMQHHPYVLADCAVSCAHELLAAPYTHSTALLQKEHPTTTTMSLDYPGLAMRRTSHVQSRVLILQNRVTRTPMLSTLILSPCHLASPTSLPTGVVPRAGSSPAGLQAESSHVKEGVRV